MKVDLSLKQRAFILISVPLLFEITFVAVLSFLLHQAEFQAARAERARRIIGQASGLTMSFLLTGEQLLLTKMTPSQSARQNYKQLIAQLPEQLETLGRSVAGNAREEKLFSRVRKVSKRMLEIFSLLYASQSFEDPAYPTPFWNTFRKEIRTNLNTLGAFCIELARIEREAERASPILQARFSTMAQMCIVIGVIFNIVLAVFLAIYFNRGTVKRLAIVMDNTERLAHDRPLNAPVTGKDEIGRLDMVFHRMAAALERARQNEKAIIAHMPVGLAAIKDDATISLVNNRLLEIFEMDEAEVIGQDLSSLIDSQPPGMNNELLPELKNKALGRAIQLQGIRKNGDTFPIELSMSELRATDETGYLVAIQDVTELYELQRLKEEFVALVSHELRTPLTTIQLFLDNLKHSVYGTLSEKGNRKIGSVLSESYRLIALINDLLDSEKAAAGHLELELRPVCLDEIAKYAIETVRALAERNAVSLHLELPSDPIQLVADRDRLIQVLINLLSNAIKYSPEQGNVTLAVRDDNQHARLSVKDQGRGIPEAFRPLLFQKYRQAHPSDATKRGGTGLGLALCKSIVEQHGGRIGVDSEEGQGSEFWFVLPLGVTPGSTQTPAMAS